jgi:hypothetical protein
MRSRNKLEELLRQHDNLTLFVEEEEGEQCEYAKQFEAYLKTVCRDALQNPSHISVNECYLEMFKKYMEWRMVVEKDHRYHTGERGHRCLWHALEYFFLKVKLVELALPSAKLYLPPALSLPPPPLFPSTFGQE